MALTTQQRDRLQRTEFWQNAVANMETFEIPGTFRRIFPD